jgi:tetratricopeptide (TPR) repeat protein
VRAHAADPRVLAAAADASRALLMRAWELARRAEPRRQDVLDLMRLAGDLVEHDDDACARARLDEAEYLYRRAHHEEALERARAAPARGPLARERALAVARNLRGVDQAEDARTIFEALMAERPDDVPGLLAAATLRADAWDYPASNALAERALELDPDCRPAMHLLAIGHAFRRGEARALELVARARALAPDDAHMDVCEAYARMFLRETDAAVAAFTRAMELAAPRPFHKAIKWRGVARFRASRHADALGDFDACLRLRPRDADVLIYRGVTLLQLGERPRAVADWRAAYALDEQFFRRRMGDMAPAVRELMIEAVKGP